MKTRILVVKLLAALMVWLFPAVSAAEPAPVYIVKLTGAIAPGNADFLDSAIGRANAEGARCLIFMLDSPGGLADSMRKMSAENNTTTVSPLPLDLFRPFIKLAEKAGKG